MKSPQWLKAHKFRLTYALVGFIATAVLSALFVWAVGPAMLEDTPARILTKQRFGVVGVVISLVVVTVSGWFWGRYKDESAS